jgi:2-polyprenyl-3-methyl-5-hydroxy-6-metoxy-1,4-benzoquinol methylase
MTKYRERIYSQYVNARQKSIAPATLDGLKQRAPYINKLIKEHFPSDNNASIVDLGCGHGAVVHFVHQNGYKNIRGIDYSVEQVAEAKRLGIEGIEQGDLIEALQSLPDSSQDMVIAFDVIEHFTKDELIPFVDEVFRVLRKGGKWLIHCPNGESPFGPRMFFGDFTHELAFTRTSIAQLLLASGFAHVSSHEDKPVVHGLKSMIRRCLWETFRLFLRLYLAAETGAGEKECIFSQNFLIVAVK